MKKIKILKGWHYAFILFGRLGGWYYNKNEYHFKFNLSKECWWSPKRNSDDGDLNKLIGLSFGVFGIHKDSLRLAWRPVFDNVEMIEIHAYVYDKSSKVTIKRLITRVLVEDDIDGTFKMKDKEYHITVADKTIIIPNNSPDKKIHKLTYPYFGGNNTAPQTMTFYIKCEAN